MISLAFAAVLLAGAPAASQAAATVEAKAAAATPAKGEKPKRGDIVCKKEQIVGSRMPKRLCMTQEDWDLRRDEGRDELKKIQQGQPFEAR